MAKTKYGYAESRDIKATKCGHNVSVVDATNTMENGMLVALGDDVTTDGIEIRKAVKPAKADTGLVLVLNPVIIYDESTSEAQSEYYYNIEPNTPARTYELVKNDRFAVSTEAIAKILGDKPVVGNYLVVDTTAGKDTRKFQEVAAAGIADCGFVAKIVAVEEKSNLTLVRVRVEAN